MQLVGSGRSARKYLLIVVLALVLPFADLMAQVVGPKTQQLFAEAQAYEKSAQLDKAIENYLEIVRLNPKLPAGHNNLGRLYYQRGRLEDASKQLRLACDLDPKLQPPRALLGFVYFQLGNFEGARRELKVAAQLDSKDVNTRLFLARSLVELNDLAGAVKLLQQLQAEDPKNTEVLFTLGNAYSSLAEKTIGQIQTVDPNSYLIEVLLGSFSEVKQVYKDAAEHYKRAIDRAPDIPDLYYRYAHALWVLGDAQAAILQYKRALELNPYDYRALWEQARAVLTDNPEDAVQLSTRALEIKPKIEDALVIRARALLALQKAAEAAKDLKEALALNPDDAGAHFQLARAYRQMGLKQEAQQETALYERLDQASRAAKEQPSAVAK